MDYFQHEGFKAVASLVQAEGKPFNQDPRGGPWATVIKSDAEFAVSISARSPSGTFVVGTMRNQLFDRDTAPGAGPEDLLRRGGPRADSAGARQDARDVGRALSGGVPAASGIWDVPVRIRNRCLPCRRGFFLARRTGFCRLGNSSSTVIRLGMMPCSSSCWTIASSMRRFGSRPYRQRIGDLVRPLEEPVVG